jgi:hypothetical protein
MARALEAQLAQADIARLRFDERLALLIDREEIDRHNAVLTRRLRHARLRQSACPEDIDYRKPRGLDRVLLQTLVAGRWLAENTNVVITGKTVTGKSSWPVRPATRPRATAIRCATSASLVCSMNWDCAGAGPLDRGSGTAIQSQTADPG